MGFSKSAFKYEWRAHIQCFNNGPALVWSSIMLAYKLLEHPENDDLTYNFNDSLTTLISICSITDTIQGVIFLNLISYVFGSIDDQVKHGGNKFRQELHILFSTLYWMVKLIDLWSILPDLVELS